MEPIITAKELLDAGAHFGHHTGRWNPAMEPFIFARKNKIHIINLRETIRGILSGYYFLKDITSKGGEVLFVGTKNQAKEAIRKYAKDVNSPFVAERWLGGTLTNLDIIRKRVKRWDELDHLENEGIMQTLSKKMVSTLRREKRRIERNLEGIRDMKDVPAALFVIDPSCEAIAVHEARTMGLPVIAIIDTDSDPNKVDIPIPSNDDSFRSIELILSKVASAIKDGKAEFQQHRAEEDRKRKTETKKPKGGPRGGKKKVRDIPLPSDTAASASPDEEPASGTDEKPSGDE